MVTFYSLDRDKKSEETDLQYIQRICSIKSRLNLTWKGVANLLNSKLNLSHSPSWYSKGYHSGKFVETTSETITSSSDDTCDGKCETCDDLSYCLSDWSLELSDKEKYIDKRLQELSLKKVEVSDLVTQNNAYIRRMSREQTIKDIAHDYALTMNKDKVLYNFKRATPVDEILYKEGILLLSDWHYGMICDNPWNVFNTDVCKERVQKLLYKVIDIIKQNKISRVHVLDLADLIAGRIHTQIRIESRFDVITQTMEVAELLAEFLNELSLHVDISFYSCLDNHSRLEPNKKESMDLESLARLIPWYLVERLKDNDNIEICDNTYGADIITCTVCSHRVIGVHGDNDSPKTALERLSLMTKEHYDMLCTAHLHHMSLEEDHGAIVVSNASLMGVDRFAQKLRLTSDPSQTFIVATPENICECIYRIVLN